MTSTRLIAIYDSVADRLQVGWEGATDTYVLYRVAEGLAIGVDSDGNVVELLIDFAAGEWPSNAQAAVTEAFGSDATRWLSNISRDVDRELSQVVPAPVPVGADAIDPRLPGEPGVPDVLDGDEFRVPLPNGRSLAVTRHAGIVAVVGPPQAVTLGRWLVITHRRTGELLGCCELEPDDGGHISGSMTFASHIPTSILHFSLTFEPLVISEPSIDRRRAWLAQLLASSRSRLWRSPARAEREATTAATIARHIGDSEAEHEATQRRRQARRFRVGRSLVLMGLAALAALLWTWSGGTDAPIRPDSVVYFENCDAARAAGPTPLTTSDPGYRIGLDRDRDGLACE